MDGKASELTVLMEMLKLKGEVATLKAKLERAYDRHDAVVQQREQVSRDLALVAGVVARSDDFIDWLMGQDMSSAVEFCSPKKIKRVSVEGKSDVELAIAFAGRG